MNQNVKLTFAFNFLFTLSSGVWARAVLSGFLYELMDQSNTLVGICEAIQGVANLLSAIPAGILADRWRRDRVLWIAIVLGLAGASGLFLLFFQSWGLSKWTRYYLLCTALGFWGMFIGVSFTVIETIFADSVSADNRSQITTHKRSLYMFGSVAGPITAICLFIWQGDTWTLRELGIVGCSGIGVAILGIITTLPFFSDKNTLGDESEMILRPREGLGKSRSLSFGLFLATSKNIPHILFITDMLFAVASGMTIKFFPLFFKNECGFTPITVNIIYGTTFIFLTVFTYIAQYISRSIGNASTCCLFSGMGVCFLFFMSFFHQFWKTWYIIIPVYTIRTVFMNCCGALRKSILMDFVPKKKRGFWNSLDGVRRFGWSGSAALGGYLVDKYGYGITFLATASLQLSAVLVMCSLIILTDVNSSSKPVDHHGLQKSPLIQGQPTPNIPTLINPKQPARPSEAV